MKQRIKSIFIYLPKMIFFGLALLNFLYIQSHLTIRASTTVSFPAVIYWYEKSIIDVLILLAASVFLLISKRWCYLIAGALSGYVVAYGLFYLIRAIRYFGLIELWTGIQKSETNIFLTWEAQLILAIIIFGFTVFYLIREKIFSKNVLQ